MAASYNNPLLPKPKRERVATYNMTAEQLQQYQDAAQREGYTEAIYICNAMYTAAMLTSLRECLGFGQRRLKYIHDQVQKNFEALRDGEISYQDVAQALMDECRINLVIERPDGLRRSAEELFAAIAKAERRKVVLDVARGKKNDVDA